MLDSSVRLRRAIFANDLVLARRIIKNNPRCIRSPDSGNRGNTPLHLAAALGFIEIAMYLVEAGHEDEGISRNLERETPLMCAVASPGAWAEDMVRLLAARFPRCICWTNRSGLDAFQLAARRGSDRMLTLLLSLSPARGELLHHADADGNTALHLASAYGNMKCIGTLVAAGADPVRQNAGGFSPIDYSSTVSAEVYFRSMVMELEKKQRDAVAQAVIDNEVKTRRRGGSKPEGGSAVTSPSSVRLVEDPFRVGGGSGSAGSEEMTGGGGGGGGGGVGTGSGRARSPSIKTTGPGIAAAAAVAARETGSGRATPIGWRDNWTLGLRGRAGSAE